MPARYLNESLFLDKDMSFNHVNMVYWNLARKGRPSSVKLIKSRSRYLQNLLERNISVLYAIYICRSVYGLHFATFAVHSWRLASTCLKVKQVKRPCSHLRNEGRLRVRYGRMACILETGIGREAR